MASAAPELHLLSRDQAFEHLYRRYLKDVYRYALALLRNPADAEDVTQTTFMNAYRAYKRGERPVKPQNWLIKIAHNAARTRYARASRRVREVPLEEHVDRLAVPDDDKPDVRAVLEALGRLPLNQRAALVMRELEGRSYAEIAETLDVSVPAVETLIFRARRSMRMNASAIRALAAVPLPGSLSQLFGAGGVVAGGGAAVGSSFLLKAAVAIVAGIVATGVGGSRSGPRADAARPLVQGTTGSGSVQSSQTSRAAALPAARARAVRQATSVSGPVKTAPAGRLAEVEHPGAPVASTQQHAPATGGSTAPAPLPPPPSPPATAALTTPVESAVQTGQGALAGAPQVTPPAAPPPLPATPDVPLPAVPSLPSLP